MLRERREDRIIGRLRRKFAQGVRGARRYDSGDGGENGKESAAG
jgi:hypothetical protein